METGGFDCRAVELLSWVAAGCGRKEISHMMPEGNVFGLVSLLISINLSRLSLPARWMYTTDESRDPRHNHSIAR